MYLQHRCPPRRASTRRYTPAEKAQAVRLVRELRDELGTEHGTVQRVAGQLGSRVEPVCASVRETDIDEGQKPTTTSADTERIKALERRTRS